MTLGNPVAGVATVGEAASLGSCPGWGKAGLTWGFFPVTGVWSERGAWFRDTAWAAGEESPTRFTLPVAGVAGAVVGVAAAGPWSNSGGSSPEALAWAYAAASDASVSTCRG